MKLFKHDPQEDDATKGPLIDAAQKEAAAIVERECGAGPGMGKTPYAWKLAAEILRERHGIEWKNPMQMNSGLFVD